MSPTRRPEGGRLSLRSGRLLLLAALFLGGAARTGAAQAPPAVSFLPPITYDQPAPTGLERVIGNPLLAADVDGDGRLDLVVITRQGLSILYGNGDGTFAPPVDLPLGPGLQEGTVADVNGDGLPDLVYCDFDRGKVAVLINQGGRRFSSPYYYAASDGPVGITAADFNGDGKPDLAIACHLSGDLVVLLNRGDGAFLPPVSLGRVDYPGAVLSADFNGDGKIDLAEASLTENVVRVLLGDGTGHFTEKGRYGADDGYPARGVTADFNGDGIPDLAIGCQDQYAIFFGDRNGGLGPAVRYSYPGGYVLGTGDFDGDGAPDLVTPNRDAGGFSVYLNRQGGNFLPALVIPQPGEKTSSLVVGDFNGDGRPDVVTWNETSPHLAVFLNSTPPPRPAIPAPVPPAPAPAALALFPDPVPGGLLALGQVTLPQPAGAGGVLVALTSSNPTVALVPAAVTTTPGAAAVTFPILTFPVNQPTPVTITASSPFGRVTATLQVLPLASPLPFPPPPAGVQLLVSSDTGDSVQRFDGRTGAFIDTFVPSGSGGLAGPHGLAIGPDGNLYVASRLGRSVLRFDGRTGAFLGPFIPPGSGGLDLPIALAFGPDGNLYVSSNRTDQILRYDGRTGVWLGAFVLGGAGGLSAPYAMLFGPDGSLYVASEGRNSVFRFDGRTGAFQGEFVTPGSGGLLGPNGLAFGPDGDLYVSSWQTQSVLRYDGRTGAFRGVFVPARSGGLTDPWDLAFGPDGNLYVASAGTDQVLRYDGRTGAFLGVFAAGGRLSRPVWLLFVPGPPSPLPAPTNLLINGVPYAPSGPQETLTATFTQPDGGVTVSAYQGYVLLHVTGVGQSYGPNYNDAFYIFTGPFNAPQNGWDGGYYQLAFGTSPLGAFDAGSDAANFLVGPLPPYNPAHDYTFVLNTRLSSPGHLHFGVSDGGFNDNTGAYVITVSQLAPLP